MSRGRRLRRVVLVLTVAAAVAVMHALSMTGGGHHGSGSSGSLTSAMATGADVPSGHASGHGAGHRARPDAPANRPATPEPVSHWLSMSVCAFAVLIATRLLRRVAGPRRRVPVPAHDPAVRLVVGPEPPVPRFAV